MKKLEPRRHKVTNIISLITLFSFVSSRLRGEKGEYELAG